MKKLTIDFVRAEFKKLGYTLITKTYLNAKQILEVRCRKGHKWATNWNNFAKGARCRHCFMESQVKGCKALKKIVLRDKYFSISGAARILGVKDGDLRRRNFGTAKKYYKIQDIKKIEEMIE